ncbi:MAG: topoisomerase DNA-binding C4 zinc finger domain-containing protein [Candidatus Eremiobacteraeota bacterium]|nr:topoisomerase DNA-binding C4 zinc finger domain-containing protein [Candidatus Eremiobacteraeota bacterium]MBC5827840.1 topoisomerase DNA-binding C4 zinc finger domain-containing protein [Candidatus Eremiobacteraeota bacterium]
MTGATTLAEPLEEQAEPPAPPPCPTCGSEMVARVRRRDDHKFFGCSTYPRCHATVDEKGVHFPSSLSFVGRKTWRRFCGLFAVRAAKKDFDSAAREAFVIVFHRLAKRMKPASIAARADRLLSEPVIQNGILVAVRERGIEPADVEAWLRDRRPIAA